MGQKIKRENSFDTLLDQALGKQGHGGSAERYTRKGTSRIWPRRHVRLTLSLTMLLVVRLGSSVLALQNVIGFTAAGPNGLSAVLIDGLSVRYPTPSFTNNATKTLSSAAYAVHHLAPD